MAGGKREYEGGLNLNALKVIDLSFLAVGKVRFYPTEKEDYSIYIKNEPEKNIYRKLVFKEGIIVGAITIGQSDDIGVLHNLIKKRAIIENRAKKILHHGINYAKLIKDKFLMKTVNIYR